MSLNFVCAHSHLKRFVGMSLGKKHDNKMRFWQIYSIILFLAFHSLELFLQKYNSYERICSTSNTLIIRCVSTCRHTNSETVT